MRPNFLFRPLSTSCKTKGCKHKQTMKEMESFDHHTTYCFWYNAFCVEQTGMFFLTKQVQLGCQFQEPCSCFSDPFSFTKIFPLSIPSMIAFSSIYGDIFPATLDGGYSVGGGQPGHYSPWSRPKVGQPCLFATHPFQSGKLKQCLKYRLLSRENS